MVKMKPVELVSFLVSCIDSGEGLNADDREMIEQVKTELRTFDKMTEEIKAENARFNSGPNIVPED